MGYKHISAMPDEVLHYLDLRPGKIYVDGTLGGCGHSKAILEKIGPDGRLIGIDQDIDSIENAKDVLSAYKERVTLVHDNFANLPDILSGLNIEAVDGILIDIGLSQHQLSGSGRGFSFQKDEPLDMRMDIKAEHTAEYLVNVLSEKELVEIFFKYGEEKFSRRIAKNIVIRRKEKAIKTSIDLAEIVTASIPVKNRMKQKIHPATRIFQAIRIAVNKELERLETFMDSFHELLNTDGRLCVLTFHSLEDRIVKKKIKELEIDCICPKDFPKCVCDEKRIVKSLTRRVVIPGKKEINDNPMARSTKLRAAVKL
ncbi:MAG: 16S rRNA (cytosine(1402)-N(4))-methyltransferase RsmH [Desulfobacterales bacterium]|nr:16S rRNA (cytosine(1402)-N(4))-methyltransferase RsmH [Desulfobacterales bacterium]MCP4160361.1 16S rRNA (cytosine(1402)-N(4))-methyltransferase RsmH [Deltaproteobacteria bacterium]